MMIHVLLPVLLIFGSSALWAQSDPLIYKGLRISTFQYQVLKRSDNFLLLRCKAANTGRYSVNLSRKNKRQNQLTLTIELDSTALPQALAGRTLALRDAIFNKKLRLDPGEIREDLILKIDLSAPELRPNTFFPTNSGNCPDLRFDTAFVVQRGVKNLLLHYRIHNNGPAAARISGRKPKRHDNVGIQVYFVSGDRLTRGAVLAGGFFLRAKKRHVLLPGAWLEGDLEIDLENRTRFSPRLALELDPFLAIEECDRTNNTWIITLD